MNQVGGTPPARRRPRIRGLSGQAFYAVCGLAVTGFLIGGRAAIITSQVALGVIIADIGMRIVKGFRHGRSRARQAHHHPGAAGRAGRHAGGAFGPCPCARCGAGAGAGSGVKLVFVTDETITAARPARAAALGRDSSLTAFWMPDAVARAIAAQSGNPGLLRYDEILSRHLAAQSGPGRQVVVHAARGHGKTNLMAAHLASQLASYGRITDAAIAEALKPASASPPGGRLTLRLHTGTPGLPPGGTGAGSGYSAGTTAVTPGTHIHSGGTGGAGGGGSSGPVSVSGGSGGSSSGGAGGGGGGGQYASGGLVVTPGTVYGGGGASPGGGSPWRPWSVTEFDRGGVLDLHPDESSEPEFAAGSVTGYRWWTIRAPDLNANPAWAAEKWEPGLLTGVYGPWEPGVNIAACKAQGGRPHDPADTPSEACRCGYWAYWNPHQHSMRGARSVAIFGVIKGYGKVLIGDRGFRAGKARLIAASVGATILPEYPQAGPSASLGHALARHPGFTGRVRHYGMFPDEQPAYAPSEDELRAARDQAEAWMAVITDRIEVMYPGVKVYESPKTMIAMHPSTPQFVPGNACASCGTALPPGTSRHLRPCADPDGYGQCVCGSCVHCNG